MNGVDISHYQKGLTIRQLKQAGYDFAIIKLTEGVSIVDDAAFAFYREAYELGFPVGCYCYSHAATAKEASAEAGHLLDTLNGFPMPLGIYLDVEEPKQLSLPHDALLDVLDAWCAGIAQHGYIPGVYGSEGNLWTKVNPDELRTGALIWTAKWSRTPPHTPCDLWQSSDKGMIAGCDGPVDTDEVRSERFRKLVEAPSQSASPTAPPEGEPSPNPSVMVLQLLMNYNGCWDRVDGIGSAAFFAALRAFTDRLEGET